MKKRIAFWFCIFAFTFSAQAQDQHTHKDTFQKLKKIAVIKKKVMIPMSNGAKLSTNIYRPKTDKKVPILFSRTPYNFNSWGQDGERNYRTDLQAYEAVKRGYAFVIQNEQGRYYSTGEYHILGAPLSNASDMFRWLRNQPWSSGKIGLKGCSSSAEWQLAAASLDNAADAMVPMGYGAGIGELKTKHWDYYEQGNWYRGGAFQMLMAVWLYHWIQGGSDMLQVPDSATHADLLRLSRYYQFGPVVSKPRVDWSEEIKHLPLDDLLEHLQGLNKVFNKNIVRKPGSNAWKNGGLYHTPMDFNVPSFWFASWYDVSDAANLAMYNHVRSQGSTARVRNNQYMVIAPTTHCGFGGGSKNDIVGERNIGDDRFSYDKVIWDWFDYKLKGEDNSFGKKTPYVRYYTMGSNKWQSSDTWPPKNIKVDTFYLDSNGDANSLHGNGKLSTSKPEGQDQPDEFTYNPQYPVPTVGGGFCCMGEHYGFSMANPGAIDQHQLETRDDIMVYTTPPLKKGVEVSGSIYTTLYIGSDAKDTDFTIKLVDVYPDGTAYNVASTIMRARYRNGFKKETLMKDGKVYKLKMPPMATSNYFKKGHRIRIDITSSNFPRFARNLNTGGNNYDEKDWVVAKNKIFHSSKHPSQIKLPIKVGSTN